MAKKEWEEAQEERNNAIGAGILAVGGLIIGAFLNAEKKQKDQNNKFTQLQNEAIQLQIDEKNRRKAELEAKWFKNETIYSQIRSLTSEISALEKKIKKK